MPDLPGDGDFDNPDTADQHFVEDDKWTTARAYVNTVGDEELADPELSAERLLFRLFNEPGVRVFEPIALEERCTCSAERIESMLRHNFSAEERAEMQVDGGSGGCEFCSADYHSSRTSSRTATTSIEGRRLDLHGVRTALHQFRLSLPVPREDPEPHRLTTEAIRLGPGSARRRRSRRRGRCGWGRSRGRD